MDPRSEAHSRRFWLLGIVTAGMILRVLWVLLVPVEPVSDSYAYAAFARNLAAHGVYGWTPEEPGAYWAVGTSAITAATFLLFGDTYAAVAVLNLLASLAIMLTVHSTGRILTGAIPALCAAAAIAFWPNLIMFTSILSSELWFIALTMAGFFFWVRREGESWVNLLLCGLMWGLACYVRPVVLLLPVALALTVLPKGLAPFMRATGKAAVAITLILLVVSPWTWRNYQLFREPVLVSTNFGPNFWMGNNPDTTGGYMPLPDWIEGMSETERARALGDLAKQHIRGDVPGFLARTLVKAAKLHSRETIGVAWNEAAIRRGLGDSGVLGLKLIATGYWYLMLTAALTGLWLLARRDPFGALLHPVFVGWAYFTALHAIVVVEDRYHMPSSPFIALLAGVTLALGTASFAGAEAERAGGRRAA